MLYTIRAFKLIQIFDCKIKKRNVYLPIQIEKLCLINYIVIIFILALKRAENDML